MLDYPFSMPGDITVLLRQWSQNPDAESSVHAQLAPLVYDHLRQVARAYVSREYGANDLNATGLVHELFLRLVEIKGVDWQDRSHFFTFAARMMRNILVDEARRRSTQKRGALERVPLAGDLAWVDASSEEMIDLHTAFEELFQSMPDVSTSVELRVFLGCTSEEAASVLGIGKATVDRHMRFARAWLYDRLRGGKV
jgi:RNA polymerase sigma factor (TIGR02999 family)